MTTRSAALLLAVLASIHVLYGRELRGAAVAQAPAAGQTTGAQATQRKPTGAGAGASGEAGSGGAGTGSL